MKALILNFRGYNRQLTSRSALQSEGQLQVPSWRCWRVGFWSWRSHQCRWIWGSRRSGTGQCFARESFFHFTILLFYRRKVGLWDSKKLLDREECSLLISQDLSKRRKSPTNYAIVMKDNNVFSNRSRALPVILFYPSKIAHNNLLFFQTIFW